MSGRRERCGSFEFRPMVHGRCPTSHTQGVDGMADARACAVRPW
jgi:hypothetical protein